MTGLDLFDERVRMTTTELVGDAGMGSTGVAGELLG